MDGAIATLSDIWTQTESVMNSIGRSFKAFVLTNMHTSPYSDRSKYFRIEIPESKTIVAV